MRASATRTRPSPIWRRLTRNATIGWSGSTWTRCWTRFALTRASRTSCAALACRRRLRPGRSDSRPSQERDLPVDDGSNLVAEPGGTLLIVDDATEAHPESRDRGRLVV